MFVVLASAIAIHGAHADQRSDFLAGLSLECPGCDLQGAMLKRSVLNGANLENANLAGANLHDASLNDVNLAGADLSGANLNKASLLRAQLNDANLTDALLFAADLSAAVARSLGRGPKGFMLCCRTKPINTLGEHCVGSNTGDQSAVSKTGLLLPRITT